MSSEFKFVNRVLCDIDDSIFENIDGCVAKCDFFKEPRNYAVAPLLEFFGIKPDSILNFNHGDNYCTVVYNINKSRYVIFAKSHGYCIYKIKDTYSSISMNSRTIIIRNKLRNMVARLSIDDNLCRV